MRKKVRTYVDAVNKMRMEMGLPPLHPSNALVPPEPPLPRKPPRDDAAWTAWYQTMYLSDGDRDAADAVFDAVRRQERKEK